MASPAILYNDKRQFSKLITNGNPDTVTLGSIDLSKLGVSYQPPGFTPNPTQVFLDVVAMYTMYHPTNRHSTIYLYAGGVNKKLGICYDPGGSGGINIPTALQSDGYAASPSAYFSAGSGGSPEIGFSALSAVGVQKAFYSNAEASLGSRFDMYAYTNTSVILPANLNTININVTTSANTGPTGGILGSNVNVYWYADVLVRVVQQNIFDAA